ncbi:MAG: DUF4124 domain-containing protein [Proteobacteria bacterium]|nr:DUF4124 domain-containing protein [Pseudomonadota bacterium]
MSLAFARPASLRMPLVAALCALACTGAAAQQTYKWVDDKGVVHYTDTMPPDQVNKGATVLDKQAVPIRKIDPPLTAAQRAAKDEEDRRIAAAAKAREESERADRALMQSFSTEGEITLSKNRALATIDSQIQSTNAFIAQLSKRRDELVARKTALGSKPVPEALEREIESVDDEIGKQQALVAAKKQEYAATSARYDGFTVRWRELKAQADARAAGTSATSRN